MNTKYSNSSRNYVDCSLVFTWNPFAYKDTSDAEMRLQSRDERDPEQAPRPGRGDRYILVCALAGIVIGGATGAIIGYHFLATIGGIYGFFGGIILGGIIGAFIGSFIKKRVVEKTNTKNIPSGPDNVEKAC